MNAGKRACGAGRWMHGTSPVLSVCICAAVLAGCGEVQFNWQRAGQTKPAKTGSGTSGKASAPTTAPAAGTATTQPANADVATRPPAPAAQPAPQADYLQLVLVNEPAPANPPVNLTYVRLERGQPSAVAEVLRRLYVPIGVHGIERCVLIYSAPAEVKGAAEFARVLDVAPVVDVPKNLAAEPKEAFVTCVAAHMANRRAASVNRKALAELAPLFEKLAGNESAPPVVRWASAVLAGDIYAGLAFEFNRAEQLLIAAEAMSPMGSVEQLNVLYARARAQMLANRKDRATALFGQIVSQFTACRHTEPYLRARAALEQERGR